MMGYRIIESHYNLTPHDEGGGITCLNLPPIVGTAFRIKQLDFLDTPNLHEVQVLEVRVGHCIQLYVEMIVDGKPQYVDPYPIAATTLHQKPLLIDTARREQRVFVRVKREPKSAEPVCLRLVGAELYA